MAGVSKDAPLADPLELADYLIEHPPAPPEPEPRPNISSLRERVVTTPPVRKRTPTRGKTTAGKLATAERRAARKATQDVQLPTETPVSLEEAQLPPTDVESSEEDIFVPDPGLDALPPLPEPTTLPEALPLPGPVSAQGDGWSCAGGHQNTAQAKFCLECGSPREQQRRCPAGHVNPEAAKFCGECGSALVVAASGSATMQALAMRSPTLPDLRPKPEHELTEQEKAEREAQHAAAVAAGQELPPLQYELPTGQTYLIHILEDGFTFAGQVWYRGQQLEFIVGSARWVQAQAWIGLDDWAQMAQYGKIYFRPGPWPGKRYTDALAPENQIPQLGNDPDKPAVKGPSQQELERADELERRRRNAVPAPSYR